MALKLDFTQSPPQVQTLAEAQVLIGMLWELARQVEALPARVAEVEEQVSLSSRNSSQPPAPDRPGAARLPTPTSGRPRGGQQGHPGPARALLPPEPVDTVIACRPPATVCGCGQPLAAAPTPSWRHQVTELPEVKPQVTEYQGFDFTCPQGGTRHEAPLPKGVPAGQLGARGLAEIGLLAGRYHLSLRLIQAWLQEHYGLSLRLGTLSAAHGRLAAALAAVTAPVHQAVREAEVVPSDETRRRYCTERRWLWVAAPALWVACCTTVSRGPAEAQALLGELVARIVITDRYSASHWLPLERRQLCWAPLLRDFEAPRGPSR